MTDTGLTDPDLLDAIADCHASGWTIDETCEETGAPSSEIRALFAAWGKPERHAKQPKQPKQPKPVKTGAQATVDWGHVAEVLSTCTVDEAMTVLGRSRETVLHYRSALKRNEWPPSAGRAERARATPPKPRAVRLAYGDALAMCVLVLRCAIETGRVPVETARTAIEAAERVLRQAERGEEP